MRRLHLGVLIVALLGAGLWWFLRLRSENVLESVCIAERKASAWNRLATVREPVAQLRYGEQVAVLEHRSLSGTDFLRIRTTGGAVGWIEARHAMPLDLWQHAVENLKKSRAMPVQASGKTKVLTNVRVEPGRSAARSFQFSRDVPVEVFARTVVEAPAEPAPKESKEQASETPQGPRREDWLFIRGRDEEAGEIAGWVLGRFLELNLPEPLRDLAAGIRFTAWFELNRVPASGAEATMEPESKEARKAVQQPPMKPQYLAVGVLGPEGQPCDFTLLRFYTWNATRRSYETAYVESNFCARLPVRVTPAPVGLRPEKGEASFTFTALVSPRRATATAPAEELREYRMRQNILRRVRSRR